ncbi:hypothetical protein V6246_18430, partial [Algibacter sp. TI.3.09]|uniref:hypothetical protein n=1 Tax=Algibacter sp. TI.3.09 TaxID=3121298 RepID=UPI00311F2938
IININILQIYIEANLGNKYLNLRKNIWFTKVALVRYPVSILKAPKPLLFIYHVVSFIFYSALLSRRSLAV